MSLIKKMQGPKHKLTTLLRRKLKGVRKNDTRATSQSHHVIYREKIECFKHNSLVYCIYLNNSK